MLAWDQQEMYSTSSESSCPSFGDSNSLSSFYSHATSDGSGIRTPPPSTRRASLDSAKFDEMTFQDLQTPDRSGPADIMSPMSSMHCMSAGFVGQSLFHNGQILREQEILPLSYPRASDFEPFRPHHSLPICTPSLDMDLSSPVSCMEGYPVSMSFVDPTQTTFVDSFDLHSPVKPIEFHSPFSDCTTSLPFDVSPVSFRPTLSSPSTHRAVRHSACGAVTSSAALQRAQAQVSEPERRIRKQVARKINIGALPNDTPIHRKAEHFCPHPSCGRAFKRSEHLKRHVRIHTCKDSFECQFCAEFAELDDSHKPKFFNRYDNLKAHIKRHGDPLDAKRTKYHPGAMQEWYRMDLKNKKGKTKTEVVIKRERHSTQPRGSGSRATDY